jgi:predicted ribosomally synthesized peptide with SipW-like signal peptide
MRAAVIVYLVIVITGLAGTGAHALWSQTGALSGMVTAGAWAPQPVTASGITCARDNEGSQVKITLNWTATDATSYTVTATGKSNPAPVTTTTTSAAFLVPRPEWFGTDSYNVTITAEAAGVKASPTPVQVELTRAVLSPTITCR